MTDHRDRYILPRFKRHREVHEIHVENREAGMDVPGEPGYPGEPQEEPDFSDDWLQNRPTSPLRQVPPIQFIRSTLFLYSLFFVLSFQYWRHATKGLWVSWSAVSERGEVWRLLTALFVHADMGHLLANSPLYLIFGWHLRAFFGFWIFPVLTLILGCASNLITVAIYGGDSRLVGASGMLYAMVGLWITLYVRHEFSLPVRIRILRATGVALLLLFPTTFQESTSYLAHASGFALGVLAGIPAGKLVPVSDFGITHDENQ